MADGAPIAVKLTNVSRSFGRRAIFAPISFEASHGTAVVVTGPNGSGKSTLLRIIAGLLPPSSGDLQVTQGSDRLDPVQRRRTLGYVAPDLFLYRELSGVENLQFFGRVAGFEPSIDYLRDLLQLVGLKGKGREFAGNYSSGMRQRLKYAFALLGSPPLLLLDEPTANLDAAGVETVRNIVERQKASGTIIIATNEPSELEWGDAVAGLSPA